MKTAAVVSLTIGREGALERLHNHDRVVRGIWGFFDRYNSDRGVCVFAWEGVYVCVCVCVGEGGHPGCYR